METKLKAKEIHEYYMDFLKIQYKGISIPKSIQKEMIKDICFLIDTD